MSDENVIKDIKESARNVKNSAKAAVVIKKWKNKSYFAYQQGKIF